MIIPTGYTIEHFRKKTISILTIDEIKILYQSIPLTYLLGKYRAKKEPYQMALKLVLDLCYGCGLRKMEVLNLQTKDINFDQKIIHIRQGKNYKDRFVPMSKEILKSIENFLYNYRRYFDTYRKGYIYPFQNHILAKAPNLLVKYCANKTIQSKKPSLHTLRHSIATHLLNNGMSIENIARFLGHSSIESTQIYTHISQQL
jgi:integrase/recombinase XerD